MRTAASIYSLDGGWDLALAVFSLVLITGGVTAMIKKVMRPAQALAILATAVIVGGIALLATGFPITVVRVAIITASTIGGIAIAAAIVTSPARKPGDS